MGRKAVQGQCSAQRGGKCRTKTKGDSQRIGKVTKIEKRTKVQQETKSQGEVNDRRKCKGIQPREHDKQKHFKDASPNVLTQTGDLKPGKLTIWVTFCVESEFEDKKRKMMHPDLKNMRKQTLDRLSQTSPWISYVYPCLRLAVLRFSQVAEAPVPSSCEGTHRVDSPAPQTA